MPGLGVYFPAGTMFFQEDVSSADPASDSDAIISALRAAGGWGNDDTFQIDFSIDVLTPQNAADAPFHDITPKRDGVPNPDSDAEFYDPDCDDAPIRFPAGGNVEGEDGYQCTNDGDCHLIVFAPFENRLYEMWRADLQGDTLYAGCQAIWRTDRTYAQGLRGDVCSSADAAGFPIAPLLFTADEIAAGHIDHAIRFILPSDRVLARQYVRPASHGTRTTGGPNTPAYGVHFRLRADYPLQDLPNDAARVVARALQRYGMYHADGGEIALTAQSDRHSATTWEAVGLEPRDLSELRVEDFEVIHHSAPMSVGEFDCTRIDTP